MATEYTIYLVNQGASTKTFWSFLQRPDELAADPEVFANSSANLTVRPNRRPATDRFVIPVQYIIGAGASNKAVGLQTRIISDFPQETDLEQAWNAHYYTVEPGGGKQGPDITGPEKGEKKSIIISANNFNKVENEANQWYGNMSFGIQTSAGYMGMTWSPDPGDKRTITPKLEFYISTGSFGSNELANFTTVSTNAQVVTEKDFVNRVATVTLLPDGRFKVEGGPPDAAVSQLDNLIRSHLMLSEAHSRLVRLADLTASDIQSLADDTEASCKTVADRVKSVIWNEDAALIVGTDDIVLTGTLTVTTVLVSAFTTFVLAGITFRIRSAPVGGTRIDFAYSGRESARNIKSLFTAGAELFLRR